MAQSGNYLRLTHGSCSHKFCRDERCAIIEDMSDHKVSNPNRTSNICVANGIEIHFLRTGGEKPSLIALHGLIASGACLLPLSYPLEGDFDVILPDARGHGRSSAPRSGYSYANLAADIIVLIEKQELKSPVLLGHSMGGLTAVVAASQLGSALSALVLIDPTFISLEWQREVYESNLAVEHRQLLELTRADLLAQARKRNPYRSMELIENLVEARLNTSVSAFEVLRPPNPDFRALVQHIGVPILLVTAERGVVSYQIAEELQRLNPLVRVEQISDVGHGLPYDAPNRLGEVIMSFLQAIRCR
jgi:N-formylmaleamate deformylase